MQSELLLVLSELYSASPDGEVFSHWRNKPKRIKTRDNGHGYFKFNAYAFGEIFTVYVHRFVWCYYNGALSEGQEINHLNFDKSDNRLINLEAATRFENMQHAIKGGKTKKPKGHGQGIRNGRACLNEKQVWQIRRRLLNGESVRRLANEYHVGCTAISNIKLKKSWKHLWVR